MTKRKLPIRMCEQLIRLHREIKDGPMKRHIALARIRAVLRWGNSASPLVQAKMIFTGEPGNEIIKEVDNCKHQRAAETVRVRFEM